MTLPTSQFGSGVVTFALRQVFSVGQTRQERRSYAIAQSSPEEVADKGQCTGSQPGDIRARHTISQEGRPHER
jgi:hypothetical protein